MVDYFFDSSALVKAYIAERGTDWARTILDDPQHRISISALAEVEVVSALTRRFNEGDLTQVEVELACDELRLDCAAYLLVDITSQVLEAAVTNARNHSLRAYDAVHRSTGIETRGTPEAAPTGAGPPGARPPDKGHAGARGGSWPVRPSRAGGPDRAGAR